MPQRDRELPVALEIQRIEEQLHIYEGLLAAMRDPHAMLEAVMHAEDPDGAGVALRDALGLDAVQAGAVLDLQFRRTTHVDRRKVADRHQELLARLTTLRKEEQG